MPSEDITQTHLEKIAEELSLESGQVEAVVALLKDGATIPFISRYRKEATDGLDEVAVMAVRDRKARLEELDQRRAAIIKSLEERELLTDELMDTIVAAETLATLEDIYLPFRPKRRTRATIAREKGLEPLAEKLFSQDDFDVESAATAFVNEEKGVNSVEQALAGARDIIAEWVNEDGETRTRLRELFEQKGTLRSRVLKGKEEEGKKFRDYFDLEEPLSNTPSHRILATRRGENEQVLTLRLQPPEEEALAILEELFVKADNTAGDQVRQATQDGYKRLLSLSLETEFRMSSKERADTEAIRVFADNLRQLLLAPPLGQKSVMAIDPGFRTGCKVVCLDRQGKLLGHDVIFPHSGEKAREEAARKTEKLCKQFAVETMAVGNGTAGRETEACLLDLQFEGKPSTVMVNESGASVYSASEVAREEFPDQDLTVRGAVSIGRRLQDPLAELVKIDPKAIGVGQYQHDVNQANLKHNLDDVVMSCVNAVGVDINTASKQLLTYVSGLGPQLAKNIVDHRDTHGPFRKRGEIKKVSRLGPKAFEQSAGFLRIQGGKNPLDASAVHPESYHVVESMCRDLGCQVQDAMADPELRARIRLDDYVTDLVGLPTLKDIMAELAKPGRDPRDSFEAFRFAEGVNKMEDLEPGLRLPGKVTNITRFGAFVDIGVHQDGLVHISQMADRFVKDPAEVIKLGQSVMVTVLEVDLERKRISLSLRTTPSQDRGPRAEAENRATSEAQKTKPTRKKQRQPSPPKADKPDANNPFVQAFKKAKWIP